jgi:hypothetical protein
MKLYSDDWVVQVEDGAHTVRTEVIGPLYAVNITWDGVSVGSWKMVTLMGNTLAFFQRNGHLFELRNRSLGCRSPVLFMDGAELPKSDALGSSKSTETPKTNAPKPVKTTTSGGELKFIKDIIVQESEEIIATERYPLDNRFGDQVFTTERQISRESTNDLSVDTSDQLRGKVSVKVLSVIKTEIEAQVSKQTGCKVGEKVAENQTLKFSVGPNSSVL